MEISTPQRQRVKEDDRKRGRDVVVKYKFYSQLLGKVPICKASFMKIFGKYYSVVIIDSMYMQGCHSVLIRPRETALFGISSLEKAFSVLIALFK